MEKKGLAMYPPSGSSAIIRVSFSSSNSPETGKLCESSLEGE
eukprot:CAMPEP_0198226888 /NCGR_PEP_ID=MMETSP1445-20131203/106982_1 /TAXON_ID=36898 /ORGANISM="Pyramimonas sp., Strain CCMP2087" /LENGTH=41 /DNA_ID= /DNA_START= /DNA_END= /DNA_ORIENTATION=